MSCGDRVHTYGLSRLDFSQVKGHHCPPALGRQRSKGHGSVNAQVEGCEPEGGATARRPGLSLGRVPGAQEPEAALYRNTRQLSHLTVAPFKAVCAEPGYSGEDLRAQGFNGCQETPA